MVPHSMHPIIFSGMFSLPAILPWKVMVWLTLSDQTGTQCYQAMGGERELKTVGFNGCFQVLVLYLIQEKTSSNKCN